MISSWNFDNASVTSYSLKYRSLYSWRSLCPIFGNNWFNKCDFDMFLPRLFGYAFCLDYLSCYISCLLFFCAQDCISSNICNVRVAFFLTPKPYKGLLQYYNCQDNWKLKQTSLDHIKLTFYFVYTWIHMHYNCWGNQAKAKTCNKQWKTK